MQYIFCISLLLVIITETKFTKYLVIKNFNSKSQKGLVISLTDGAINSAHSKNRPKT